MIVQVLSDLHLEFHRDGGHSFLESLDPTGVDVLVVAGDVNTTTRDIANSLMSLCALYPRVLFVAGNHEYYGSTVPEILHLLEGLDRDVANFTWLSNREVEIDGVWFGGTTLWFPRSVDPMVDLDRFAVNDFNLIREFIPWVYDSHRCAMEFLEEAPHLDVVVTHHIPTARCQAARFAGASINHYFLTDITPLIRKMAPKAWIFGHTHDRMWTTVGETLLVCNPFGYPHEQGASIRGRYIEKCLLEVTSEGVSFASEKPGWDEPGPLDAGGPVWVAGR